MDSRSFIKLLKYSSVRCLLLLCLFVISCKDKKEDSKPPLKPETGPLSAKASIYDVAVLTEWNDLHLKLLEQNQQTAAPLAARSLGYVSLAAYESIVKGTENASMVGQLSGLDQLPVANDSLEYNWGLAVNVAQYTLLKELFYKASAAENDEIDNLLLKFEKKFRENIDQTVIRRSIEYGASVANAVWEYAKTDGGNGADTLLFPAGYIFPEGIGAWQTLPENGDALLPQWKLLRPFYPPNKFLSTTGIIPFSYRKESDFFLNGLEVFASSNNITPAGKNSSDFWVGQSNGNFAVVRPMQVFNKTLKQRQVKLDEAALVNLKAGIAVNDAAITVWRIKFERNLLRPDTYIRETLNREWQPLVKTPATPSFPSLSATVAGIISKLIVNELGGSISSPFNQTFWTSADLKKEVVNAEILSGTNFRMCGERGFDLGERMLDNTNLLKFN